MEQKTAQSNRKRSFSRVLGGIILLIGAGLFGVLLFLCIAYFGLRPLVI